MGAFRQFFKVLRFPTPTQVLFSAIDSNSSTGAIFEIVCVRAFDHIATFPATDYISNNTVHIFSSARREFVWIQLARLSLYFYIIDRQIRNFSIHRDFAGVGQDKGLFYGDSIRHETASLLALCFYYFHKRKKVNVKRKKVKSKRKNIKIVDIFPLAGKYDRLRFLFCAKIVLGFAFQSFVRILYLHCFLFAFWNFPKKNIKIFRFRHFC